MTKDILLLSATMLGLDDVIMHLSQPEPADADDEVKTKENELIAYLNYVVSQIVKEFMPLSNCEKVCSDSSCQIMYDKLSKQAVSIRMVSLYGRQVTFNLYPEYLKVGRPNQEYEVFYNYVPEKVKDLTDNLELPLGLSEFVICYGIASEYALSKLLYDEANMWQDKYKNALENLTCRSKERRFYARKLK